MLEHEEGPYIWDGRWKAHAVIKDEGFFFSTVKSTEGAASMSYTSKVIQRKTGFMGQVLATNPVNRKTKVVWESDIFADGKVNLETGNSEGYDAANAAATDEIDRALAAPFAGEFEE